VVASKGHLSYRIGISKTHSQAVLAAVSSYLPGVAAKLIGQDVVRAPNAAWRVTVSASQRALRTTHLDEVAGQAGFRVERFRYYTPILSRIAESIFVPVAAHVFARRKSGSAGVDSAALRAARLEAKQKLARRGIMYRGLQVMTSVVMLDVRLLGRVRSGPFFALLVKRSGPG
jgi:hypothetical protein